MELILKDKLVFQIDFLMVIYGNMKVKDIVRLILKNIRLLQGSTYENVFVDVNDIVFDKNGSVYPDINDMLRRLYVACSRTKTDLIICYGR